MCRGFLCVLTLTAALPAAAQSDPGPPPPAPPDPLRPPYYSCMVEREVPGGTVSAFKLIEPSGRGVNDERLHSWVTPLSPDGVQLHAVWTDAPPAETGWITILYPMEDSEQVYRIQVLRTAPEHGEAEENGVHRGGLPSELAERGERRAVGREPQEPGVEARLVGTE